jgi:hypothetical protein
LTSAIIALPLFRRICEPTCNTFNEQIAARPFLSVLAVPTRDHLIVFFDFTPTSKTTDFNFHFVPAEMETKFPRSTEDASVIIEGFASAIWAKTDRPNPATSITLATNVNGVVLTP